MFRDAILSQLGHLGINRGELYRRAKVHCPSLSESAVYEYLRGVRDVQTPYLAALLEAAGLVIEPRKPTRRKTGKAAPRGEPPPGRGRRAIMARNTPRVVTRRRDRG